MIRRGTLFEGLLFQSARLAWKERSDGCLNFIPFESVLILKRVLECRVNEESGELGQDFEKGTAEDCSKLGHPVL